MQYFNQRRPLLVTPKLGQLGGGGCVYYGLSECVQFNEHKLIHICSNVNCDINEKSKCRHFRVGHKYLE